jgi:porphyrinogen peroxidase
MGFTLPQFGIFAQGTDAHHFLEFDLRDGVRATEAVSSFRRLRTPDVSAGGVNLVVAFGADACREVAPSMARCSGSMAHATDSRTSRSR